MLGKLQSFMGGRQRDRLLHLYDGPWETLV